MLLKVDCLLLSHSLLSRSVTEGAKLWPVFVELSKRGSSHRMCSAVTAGLRFMILSNCGIVELSNRISSHGISFAVTAGQRIRILSNGGTVESLLRQ